VLYGVYISIHPLRPNSRNPAILELGHVLEVGLSYYECICLEVNKIVGGVLSGKKYNKPLLFAGVPFPFLCILRPHINTYITISRHHKNMKVTIRPKNCEK
jgi:hypothetical protein